MEDATSESGPKVFGEVRSTVPAVERGGEEEGENRGVTRAVHERTFFKLSTPP